MTGTVSYYYFKNNLLRLLLHIFLILICFSFYLGISHASPICPSQNHLFLTHLQYQCPSLYLTPTTPLQVDGEFLDRTLSYGIQNNVSILFYASWCPFSSSVKSKFEFLSYIFPQISHLMVEEASVMPIVLSRYGVHSFPSILLANGTSLVRYHGSKDIGSIVDFYRRTTGFEPFRSYSLGHFHNAEITKHTLLNGSPRELLRREPYLVFSVLFVCWKLLLYLFPGIFTRLKAFWVSYGWHLNLGIFGETSQLLEHIFLVVNFKRVFSKLRLCKSSNFHNRAKNARVWASSLASVSLGESSSARSSSSDS